MKIKNKTTEIPQISEEYGLIDFRPLTMKERLEIYSRLTKDQRNLIDEHRKYLIRSEFIKDSYLSASDWDFVDLKMDEYYPKVHDKGNQLYCQCGRRLKYQYIVKSKATGKKMGLGIQHFKDHLNIPQQVAKEIVDRLSNVDFGLDELLWLKRKGVEFPTELWHQYALSLYRNQYAEKPYTINFSLGQRIAAFKEVDMPIYFSDYQLLNKEIKGLQNNCLNTPQKVVNEADFNQFKQSLISNLEQKSLFNRASIWSFQIQKQLELGSEEPTLPQTYFVDLYKILKKSRENREKEMLAYSNKGMGKWIQKEVYIHLLKKVEELGLSEAFLDEIHPFMREGLAKFLVFNKKQKLFEEDIKEIKQILTKYDEESKKELIEELMNQVSKTI